MKAEASCGMQNRCASRPIFILKKKSIFFFLFWLEFSSLFFLFLSFFHLSDFVCVRVLFVVSFILMCFHSFTFSLDLNNFKGAGKKKKKETNP